MAGSISEYKYGMRIKVKQRGESRSNHPIFIRAIEFFGRKLVPVKYRDSLQITLIMSKPTRMVEDMGNHCMYDQFDHQLAIDKSLPFHDIIRTIAHEMIHLKQSVLGQLETRQVGKKIEWFWKGNSYGTSPYKNLSPLEHYKLPWEKEAYDKEQKLAREFAIELFKDD